MARERERSYNPGAESARRDNEMDNRRGMLGRDSDRDKDMEQNRTDRNEKHTEGRE